MTEVSREVGRYGILREIGRGGMARVYLARQNDLDRLVALKELSAFHASDPQFAQRFLRESRLAGSLSHPNIVTVHEYFEFEGTPFIAMEYVPRGSLRPYVGRLSLAQVVGVIEGMLAGLTHAEGKGIVHRDLKPENVMVTDEGRVKIADFGIAKAGSDVGATGAFMTATGTTVGTPAYMAPEQAMARDIGPWTDLYSLGVMAYEMLVGRLPFPESEAPMVLLMKHVNEPVPPPRSINPDLDLELADWIERLLVKDPAGRLRDATEAWDELEETVIRIFGARWRREARLPAPAPVSDTPRPLTPAPFTGASDAAEPEDDDFASFEWREPAGPDAPLGTPPPSATVAPSTPTSAPTPTPAPVDLPSDPGYATAAGSGPAPPAPPAAGPPSSEPGYETAAASAPAPPAPEPPSSEPPSSEPGYETAAASAPAPPPAPEPPSAEPVAETPVPEPDFRTYGRRDAPPAPEPQPDPEPVAAPEPEPEPEPAWGATAAPSRVPPAPAPAAVAEPAARPASAATAPDGERRGVRTGALALLGVGLIVAALVGFLVAPSKKKAAHAAELSNSASSPALQLAFPSTWRQTGAAPEIPGLPLTDAVALGGPSAGATIQAGRSTASGPTLLPKAFVARLPAAPRPVAVRLGPAVAYRYAKLTPGSPAQQVTVYAIPTDAGVLTLACLGAAAVASPDCEAIATSLRVAGAKALAPGPSAAYAEALGAALSTMQSGASAAGRDLAAAKTRAGQAKAATAMAEVYGTAAGTLRGMAVGPGDRDAHDAIVTAVRATDRDLRRLASAAGKGDSAAYRRASAAITRDRASVDAAVAGLRSAGYALG
ncbi:serine/threonine protein kinase [Baekduia soli]|uniref:non-specific serine/threonine protein kinase n=1 Tax=Baekduia soli TaxID=496014 RepID=A0A5B8U620_9ACTN|nr:serine/threonine-protein kinase [Baekduia soli]QEC48470.1 serine/threonine protein kinase [Baekduia soli]